MAMKKKLAAYGFTAFLVFAVILAVADNAAAQAGGGPLSVKISEDKRSSPGVLAPETGVLDIELTVTVTVPAASGCTQLINIDYKVTPPGSWATAIPQPGSDSFLYEGDAANTPTGVPVTGAAPKDVPRDLKLTITTTRDAPAFEPGLYKITATAKVGSGSCNLQQGSGTQDITVKNGYFALIETLPIQTLLKAGQNSQVRFPVDVTNFGNGETRVSAEATYNSKNQLDALIPPAPFVLESKARQGQAAKNTKQVFVTARTPHSNGYTNDVYAFQVDFKGGFAGTAPSGEQPPEDKQTIFLSLQVQGVYAPGVDPAMFIGALGVAMLGVRRFLG